MGNRLDPYKPAAPAALHVLLAALTWTVVGCLLAFYGARWLSVGGNLTTCALAGIAAVGGLLKARYVLVPAAGRIVARIRERGDGRCIGGFLSWKTWCLVVVMALAGRFLRGGLLPEALVGFLYVAVGIALLRASFRLWRSWLREEVRA
jgi:hypothetical protein